VFLCLRRSATSTSTRLCLGHIDLSDGTTTKQCVRPNASDFANALTNKESAFKKMEPDFWIELENTYKERIGQRQALYKDHGASVLQALPGSELACKELMEMVLQFLCARYPHLFQLFGNIFVNKVLNTESDTTKEKPLIVLLNNVPEDFAITLRDPDTGRYCFRAGVICSSVGWNLGEKMGLGLPGIHKTVPDYKEKMEFSMDRYGLILL
jgi:hypothetical protein